MPGFSVTVTVLLPPVKVGVEPTTEPDDEAIVRLCSTGDLFSNEIVADPAFAVSEAVVNFSWPSGFAASESA